MSQHRVALSIADRAAARLSRGHPWAPSQPISGNRNRPALTPSSPTLTQSQSVSSIRMNRPALRSNAPTSTQSQSISGNRNRPALVPSSSKLTQSQSVSSIRMNRPALRSDAPTSTQPQSTSIIRNRPALQPSTTARPMSSTVDVTKPKALLEKAQARRERLAAIKPTNASRVADKSFSAIISDVRRVQARIAAHEARKAERTHAPDASRQQLATPAVPNRPRRCPRPRAVSPMTLLVESLDFRNVPAAPSAPPPRVIGKASPVANVNQFANLIADSALVPPTPAAPKASRFHDVCSRTTSFPAFPKPKSPPSQLKGILRKGNQGYKRDARKNVAFAKENEVHEYERWIGTWQCPIPDYYLFDDEGYPESDKCLFVWPEPLDHLIGKLRGWDATPGDEYNYTYIRGEHYRDHSDCTRGVPGRGCERGLRHRRFQEAYERIHKDDFFGPVRPNDVAGLNAYEALYGPP